MRRTRRLMVLASVLLACGCASSTSTPDPDASTRMDGPLGPGGDDATYCMAKRHANALVVGLDVARNSTSTPVTFDRAEIVGDSGVELVQARVAGISGHQSVFGRAQSIPPKHLSPEQRQLIARSRPLGGYVLAPDSDGTVGNVLLYWRLASPTRRFEVDHVRVYYHDDSGPYLWQNNIRYVMTSGANCASSKSS